MTRPSRKTLASIVEPMSEDDLPDLRSTDFNTISTALQPVAEAAFAGVFAGMSILHDTAKREAVVTAATEVSDNWDKAQSAFLTIGRVLLRLQRTLTRDEYAQLRRCSKEMFPFGDAVASILRSIAEAVEDRKFLEAECPRDYSTAGMLARLSSVDLETARARGLVRRDVQRSEVVEFRRAIRARGEVLTVDVSPAPSLADLRIEQARIATEQRQLLATLAELNRRRRALRDLLTDDHD